jgi:hypothetical protein
MGIEPKRTALQSLWNASYREVLLAACDWRANFRVMRDNVGPPETTTRRNQFSAVDPKPTATNGATGRYLVPFMVKSKFCLVAGFVPAFFQRGMSRSVQQCRQYARSCSTQFASWLFLAINWACVETRAINPSSRARNSLRTGELFVFL